MHKIRPDGVKETLHAVIGEEIASDVWSVVATVWTAEGDPLPDVDFLIKEAPDANCGPDWTYKPSTEEFTPPA